RERLEEDLVSYFQNFQYTFESSGDSTNVVNAPREPFVVKQDHGVKSSQNPPPIDECCCECGNTLYGIFCQQCICKSCGKVLDDQDLINVKDPSMVLLVKLKDVNSMSNMYVICRNEGLTKLKIHHVGGLWIWIHFHSSSSADNFQRNAFLKSIYSYIKTATPSFKVDERTWNINIVDEILDSSDNIDVNGMEKVKDSVDEIFLADLNNLNDLKETINELARNEIQHQIIKENIDQEDDINNVSP
nr:RNA-directed DNA polymerase, eukaryota [Tanacetum cinerariifolium]